MMLHGMVQAIQGRGAVGLWWGQGPPGRRRAASPTWRPHPPPACQRGATVSMSGVGAVPQPAPHPARSPSAAALQVAGKQSGAAHRVHADQWTGRHPIRVPVESERGALAMAKGRSGEDCAPCLRKKVRSAELLSTRDSLKKAKRDNNNFTTWANSNTSRTLL